MVTTSSVSALVQLQIQSAQTSPSYAKAFVRTILTLTMVIAKIIVLETHTKMIRLISVILPVLLTCTQIQLPIVVSLTALLAITDKKQVLTLASVLLLIQDATHTLQTLSLEIVLANAQLGIGDMMVISPAIKNVLLDSMDMKVALKEPAMLHSIFPELPLCSSVTQFQVLLCQYAQKLQLSLTEIATGNYVYLFASPTYQQLTMEILKLANVNQFVKSLLSTQLILQLAFVPLNALTRRSDTTTLPFV